MADPGVQLVREWLRHQPFSLRILTLILFMEEAVKDEFGEETMKSFDRFGQHRQINSARPARGRLFADEMKLTCNDVPSGGAVGEGEGRGMIRRQSQGGYGSRPSPHLSRFESSH